MVDLGFHHDVSTLDFARVAAILRRDVLTGDCDGDGGVTITELIVGVRIALDLENLETCPAFDRDGDGRVSVGELITAVNRALDG